MLEGLSFLLQPAPHHFAPAKRPLPWDRRRRPRWRGRRRAGGYWRPGQAYTPKELGHKLPLILLSRLFMEGSVFTGGTWIPCPRQGLTTMEAFVSYGPSQTRPLHASVRHYPHHLRLRELAVLL